MPLWLRLGGRRPLRPPPTYFCSPKKKKKKKEEFYFYHALTQRKIRRGCHWYDLGAAAIVARVANMTSACIWQVWDEREAKS